ncbi:MAG: DUF554 domain-containing protein [Chloroflexi bacterium]|nr:DUF554 domain-containing protein [Chloroflexota bacterium]
MIGTFLNVAAIVAGGITGLSSSRQLSPANQTRLKIGMGAFTVWIGLSMTWSSINGSFWQIARQLAIVILAMMLGKAAGKLLRLQESLNRLGHYAKERVVAGVPDPAQRLSEGFVTCSILFCVGPMSFLGALADGFTGNFKVLAVKSLMDGLATLAFVKTFGWGVMLSIIPVFAYQGTITLAARTLEPFLRHYDLLDSVNATGGLLIFCIALIILELKKVELADYLPSLAMAPLLTWLWRLM